MQETISQPVPADPTPGALLRTMLCTLCWAPPGRPCTVSGPPGDHLARYVEAVKAGLLTRTDLAAVVGGIEVLADQVIVLERAA